MLVKTLLRAASVHGKHTAQCGNLGNQRGSVQKQRHQRTLEEQLSVFVSCPNLPRDTAWSIVAQEDPSAPEEVG